MIVLGFATVVIVLPTLIAVARFIDANAAVAAQARDAATWTARHGVEFVSSDPRVLVTTSVEDGVVRSTARTAVTLVSIGGAGVERVVEASYAVPISPYRSRR
jgi:hypothetical protein